MEFLSDDEGADFSTPLEVKRVENEVKGDGTQQDRVQVASGWAGAVMK